MNNKTIAKVIAITMALMMSIGTHAQNITLSLKAATINDFVSAIQDQTSYTFVYGSDIVFRQPLNINVKSATLADVLKEVMEPEGIRYERTRQHIMLFYDKVAQSNVKTISGHVIDATSRETLIGATVYSVNDHKGTTTNSYGFFSLTLPEGYTMLHVSYMGYISKGVALSIQADTAMIIELLTDNRIEEVVVEATRPETGIMSSRTGAVAMDIGAIKSMPSFLGEPDVLKALQMLPSVQRGVSGTSIMSVRGGNRDQNLYLLDGVPFYNVDHLFGFISAFTPDATKRVDFFSSSFPSRYGGRLSSVIDVRTKDGDMQHYHGSLTLGTITSHITLEGPICDDKTSFIVSFRRSLVDMLLPLKFNFYDINAKINHIFNDRNRLFSTFYMGRDKMGQKENNGYKVNIGETCNQQDVALGWGNTMGSLRWNHIFSHKVFSNMTLARNKFYFDCDYANTNSVKKDATDASHERITDKMNSNSQIDDWMAMYDIDYNPNHSNHVKFGLQYTLHRFMPDKSSVIHEVETADTLFFIGRSHDSDKRIGNETDIYIEDDIALGDHINANVGFRFPFFVIESKLYKAVEPRLSLTVKAGYGMRFKGAYTRMHQYVHLLTTSRVSIPADLWMPISKNIKPMESDLFVMGLYYNGLEGWEASAEAYYKEMRDIFDYKDGYGFNNSGEDWEKIVAVGRGVSRGIEFSIRRTQGPVTGSVNYTFSRSERKFDRNVNNGKWFRADFDRPHKFNINAMWHISNRYEFAASWSLSSGTMATISSMQAISPNIDAVITSVDWWNMHDLFYYDGRNNYRLPNTHSLDLSFMMHRQRKWFKRTIAIGLMNAYNHHNADWAFMDEKYVDDHWSVGVKTMCMNPILPSFSYTMTF
ncbi:MAG: TonB-dependent receptor [Bacteroidales bacterium]|nr:TonB-dependent receptor [Bacteroidales bacterium]